VNKHFLEKNKFGFQYSLILLPILIADVMNELSPGNTITEEPSSLHMNGSDSGISSGYLEHIISDSTGQQDGKNSITIIEQVDVLIERCNSQRQALQLQAGHRGCPITRELRELPDC
jgi:hypothetical protein